MTSKSMRVMFATAAWFNWVAGGAVAINVELLFGLFGITPLPTEPLFLQFFAWLVIVFGIGYFWASRDPVTNVPVIKLGMSGKLSVVLVSLACVLTGSISWQIMLLVSADLLYAILFWRALKAIQR
ncbi:MAG: hypothetical protein GQ538_04130 [Xanthomonadales bacterium]|nr:hypothetical protein [Xanthomonadales bacterium]